MDLQPFIWVCLPEHPRFPGRGGRGERGGSRGPDWAGPCLEVRLRQVPAVSVLCPSRDISEAEYTFVSQFLL